MKLVLADASVRLADEVPVVLVQRDVPVYSRVCRFFDWVLFFYLAQDNWVLLLVLMLLELVECHGWGVLLGVILVHVCELWIFVH